MGFQLEIWTCLPGEGGVREADCSVKQEHITLGNALQLLVFMFGRPSVQVAYFGPKGVKVYSTCYISLLGDKPLLQYDAVPDYSDGFIHEFRPTSAEDYNQLMEMVAAYLVARPKLVSEQVSEQVGVLRELLAA